MMIKKNMNKNGNEPIISVIVPVYNSEKTIGKAIESLLAQDVDVPFEALFALGEGNVDSSREIIETYAKENDNLRLVLRPYPMRPGRARIEAIKEAKGEYLAFLDSDDRYPKDALRVFYKTIKDGGVDIVNSSFLISEGSKKTRKNLFTKKCRLDGSDAILRALFEDSYFRSFLCTKMIRRSLFLDTPFLMFAGKDDLFEDAAILGSVLLMAKSAISISEPLYVYNKAVTTSETSLPRHNRHEKHLDVYMALREFYEQSGRKDAVDLLMHSKVRTVLSLMYDMELDKKNGASKEYLQKEKERRKKLFAKKRGDDAPLIDIGDRIEKIGR